LWLFQLLIQCLRLSAEGAISPFVVGRNNRLFSDSTKGAESSALLYNVIETAKKNNSIVEKYLLYLMNKLSNIDPTDKDNLLKILPISSDLPEDLKIKTNR